MEIKIKISKTAKTFAFKNQKENDLQLFLKNYFWF
jgi:hypothetical protein